MRSHLHAYAHRIYVQAFRTGIGLLKILASSSSLHASYVVSVRRASALPAASFRFHLAMDTLAVRLTIPPVGFVGDFHSLVRAPCRAHQKKRGGTFIGFRLVLYFDVRVSFGMIEASRFLTASSQTE